MTLDSPRPATERPAFPALPKAFPIALRFLNAATAPAPIGPPTMKPPAYGRPFFTNLGTRSLNAPMLPSNSIVIGPSDRATAHVPARCQQSKLRVDPDRFVGPRRDWSRRKHSRRWW